MAGTTVYNINKPTVAGDSGVWGGFLNTGMDTIDNEIARSRIPFVSPTYNVAGTTTLDLNQTTGARVFVFTVSGASTLAFSNVPTASFDCKISLIITNGSAFVLTFPASVTWLAGIAPTFKASGVDIVDLETKDGGTTWYATLRNLRPGVIFQKTYQRITSTVDASATSYVLPAGTLAVDGQAVRITCRGSEDGAQVGTVHIKFGATDLVNQAMNAAGGVWGYDAIVGRRGATNQVFNGLFWYVNPTTPTFVAAGSGSAPTETMANAITIDFRGLTANAGSPMSYYSITVELLAAA